MALNPYAAGGSSLNPYAGSPAAKPAGWVSSQTGPAWSAPGYGNAQMRGQSTNLGFTSNQYSAGSNAGTNAYSGQQSTNLGFTNQPAQQATRPIYQPSNLARQYQTMMKDKPAGEWNLPHLLQLEQDQKERSQKATSDFQQYQFEQSNPEWSRAAIEARRAGKPPPQPATGIPALLQQEIDAPLINYRAQAPAQPATDPGYFTPTTPRQMAGKGKPLPRIGIDTPVVPDDPVERFYFQRERQVSQKPRWATMSEGERQTSEADDLVAYLRKLNVRADPALSMGR